VGGCVLIDLPEAPTARDVCTVIHMIVDLHMPGEPVANALQRVADEGVLRGYDMAMVRRARSLSARVLRWRWQGGEVYIRGVGDQVWCADLRPGFGAMRDHIERMVGGLGQCGCGHWCAVDVATGAPWIVMS
jgi:hypothetical protein